MPTVTKRRRAIKRPAAPPPPAAAPAPAAAPVPNSIPPEKRITGSGPPSDHKTNTLVPMPSNIKYHPQLADWTSAPLSFSHQRKPFTATVREWLGKDDSRIRPPYYGHNLFTVRFSPIFREAAANRMLAMIIHAPEMWRMLRERIRFSLVDNSYEEEEFAEVVKLLRDAAGEPPFDVPEYTEGEESAYDTNDATRELTDERWRQAMKSPHIHIGIPQIPEQTMNFICTHCGEVEWAPSKIAKHLKTVHGIIINVPSGEVSRG